MFELIANEMESVKRLNANLDTRDARIAYQEWVHKVLQTQDQVPVTMEPVAKTEDETAMSGTIGASILPLVVDDIVGVTEDQNVFPNDLEDRDRNLMGPSVLDNMELAWSMSYLQSSSQPYLNQAF